MGSISILLADDSITIQKVVGIIFGSDDYSLTIVDNGKAAVQKALEIKPDVLLIDALMPGMSGYEVCEAIRKDASLATKPVLLLTGSFEPFDEAKARQCGADDHIVKPFESQQIVAKVQEMYQMGLNRTSVAAVAPEPVPELAPEPVAAVSEPVAAEETFVFEQTAFETPAAFEAPVAAEVTAFVPEPDPAALFQEPAPEPEPVRPADDPWGAFTQQPATEATSSAVAEPVQNPFEDNSQLDVDVMAVLNEDASLQVTSTSDSDNIGSSWVPVEEQTFEFREEVAFAPSPVVEEAVASVVLPEPEPAFSPDAFEPVAAVEPVTEHVADVPSQMMPMVETTPELPVAAVVAAPAVALTDDQLKAAILSASKETIERIVWEVVPDLAEAMIKEAIKRITEAK